MKRTSAIDVVDIVEIESDRTQDEIHFIVWHMQSSPPKHTHQPLVWSPMLSSPRELQPVDDGLSTRCQGFDEVRLQIHQRIHRQRLSRIRIKVDPPIKRQAFHA